MYIIKAKFPMTHTKMVLCFWHIGKNVVVNYKKFFKTKEA
jgi:hypothetical protein